MKTFCRLVVIAAFAVILSCTPENKEEKWCDRPLRKGWESYTEIATKYPWYKVYSVSDSVYAIFEPYNWQSVISYLIVGSEKAILFDTGMGLDSIQSVVRQLTSLPVSVINSHTHYDHIGGNADFKTIYGVDTAYTVTNSKGWSHEAIMQEVTPRALCPEHLSNVDTIAYHIRPYKLTDYLYDGASFDLGNRKIEVMLVPGHTPDCVALLDRERGLLWTGDTYYEGPLWLFFPGTDLDAYQQTITRLASLVPQLKHLLPAHNLPLIPPSRLIEVRDGLQLIRSGKYPGKPLEEAGNPLAKNVMQFEFKGFSFLIRKDLLAR